jgi:hypothetical protein
MDNPFAWLPVIVTSVGVVLQFAYLKATTDARKELFDDLKKRLERIEEHILKCVIFRP